MIAFIKKHATSFYLSWLSLSCCITNSCALVPTGGATYFNQDNYLDGTPIYHRPIPRLVLSKAKQLRLNDAILIALRNNPQIAQSELQRILDKFSLELAHNAFYPQFGFSAGLNHGKDRPLNYWAAPSVTLKTPIGTTLTTSYNYPSQGDPKTLKLTIEQPLLRDAGWLVNTAPITNAEDNEKINKMVFSENVSQAVITVIKNYRQLVQDNHRLKIQTQALNRSKEAIKQAEIKLKAGIIARADVIEQESQLATIKLNTANQNISNNLHYHAFLKSVGLRSSSKITIDPHIIYKNIHIPDLSQSIKEALKKNTDYQKELILFTIKKRTLKTIQNKTLWNLNLNANTTLGLASDAKPSSPNLTPNALQNSRNDYSFGLTLDIPFHDLATKQEILSSKIELENETLQLRQKKEDLIADVSNKINILKNQKNSIAVAKEGIQLHIQNLKNAQIKLKYGRITRFQVNVLQDELTEKEIELIEQEISFLNAITDLNHTLGKTLTDWHIHLRC